MNTLKLIVLSIATFLSTHLIAQEQILTIAETPEQIKSYVQTNFPASKILIVKKDKEFAKIDYEVKLDGNTELVFDKKFNIKEIDSKSGLPNEVIPSMIWDYVSDKYPDNSIIGWEREGKRQKVELDNDIDLYFNLNGKFIKADF